MVKKRLDETPHGEELPKAHFGPGSESLDDSFGRSKSESSDGTARSAFGDEREESAYDAFGREKKSAGPDEIKKAEQKADKGPGSASPAGEIPFRVNDKLPLLTGGVAGIASRAFGIIKRNPKKSAAAGIGGTIVTATFFIFSVAQGPLQFAQLAQLLQRIHFTSNDDFLSFRTARMMMYAMGDSGTERGRLGLASTEFADRWESRMVDRTGMRPLYSDGTGRLVGFEIVNRDKAYRTLSNAANGGGRNAARLEKALGAGVEIRPYSQLSGSRQGVHGTARGGSLTPTNDPEVLTFEDTGRGFGPERAVVGVITSATFNTKIGGAVAKRLMKKRAGINFHPFEKIGLRQWLDKKGDKRAFKEMTKEEQAQAREEYKKERRDNRRKIIRGTAASFASKALGRSGEETRQAVEEAKQVEGPIGGESLRTLLNSAKGPAVVVGVFCAFSDVGDGVEEFKYTESYLKMMQMAGYDVAAGAQFQSGEVNSDELGVHKDLFDDEREEVETSWYQADTFRQEMGKQPLGNGNDKYSTPKEARLENIQDKPLVFDIADRANTLTGGGLGLICRAINTAVEAVVPEKVNEVAQSIIDGALGLFFQTTSEELVAKMISALAGKTVNIDAEGAEKGSLVNAGGHYLGLDSAIAMGGMPLTDIETGELQEQQHQDRLIENSHKSFAQRYLDINNVDSMVGSITLDFSGYSMTAPLQTLSNIAENSFNNIAGIFVPGVKAATTPSKEEMYGLPQYGFSLAEQRDERFQDPGENAVIVEPNLDAGENLNEKYGKPCFGMTVSVSGDQITLTTGTSDDPDGELKVNPFEVAKNDKCKRPASSSATASPAEEKTSFWDKLFPKAAAESRQETDAIAEGHSTCYEMPGDFKDACLQGFYEGWNNIDINKSCGRIPFDRKGNCSTGYSQGREAQVSIANTRDEGNPDVTYGDDSDDDSGDGASGTDTPTTGPPPKPIPDEEELIRFRYYLADVTAYMSAACWEGDEHACEQIGANTSSGASESSASCGQLSGTPQDIIDNVALPIAQEAGINRTKEANDAGNAGRAGTSSDHGGPPESAWAADIAHGPGTPTPEMDKVVKDLAKCFEFPPEDWEGDLEGRDNQCNSVTEKDGYRIQLIYRTGCGGDHNNHVHIGIRVQ